MRNKDEKLCEALGNNANRYFALSNAPIKEKHFADGSSFFEKIMDDGHVYNPYIHRRWLPSQFLNIYKANKTAGSREFYFTENYLNNAYVPTLLIGEVKRLYTLYEYDREAYFEREKFFTVEILKEGLLEILKHQYDVALNIEAPCGYKGAVYDKHFGHISVRSRMYPESSIPSSLLETLEECICKVERARTIRQLFNCVRNFPDYQWDKKEVVKALNKETLKEIAKAFDHAGVYFTIKHLVMFRGKAYKGIYKNEGLNLLRDDLFTGKLFEEDYDSVLKETIESKEV